MLQKGDSFLKIKDQFRFAFRAMADRRLRTTLTIIGILIGPATIVALDAATQGYSNASAAQFSKLGATTLFVSPSARGFSLTQADLPSFPTCRGSRRSSRTRCSVVRSRREALPFPCRSSLRI